MPEANYREVRSQASKPHPDHGGEPNPQMRGCDRLHRVHDAVRLLAQTKRRGSGKATDDQVYQTTGREAHPSQPGQCGAAGGRRRDGILGYYHFGSGPRGFLAINNFAAGSDRGFSQAGCGEVPIENSNAGEIERAAVVLIIDAWLLPPIRTATAATVAAIPRSEERTSSRTVEVMLGTAAASKRIKQIAGAPAQGFSAKCDKMS